MDLPVQHCPLCVWLFCLCEHAPFVAEHERVRAYAAARATLRPARYVGGRRVSLRRRSKSVYDCRGVPRRVDVACHGFADDDLHSVAAVTLWDVHDTVHSPVGQEFEHEQVQMESSGLKGPALLT